MNHNSALQHSTPPTEPSLYVADPGCSVITACERLLCAFMRVSLVRRCVRPQSIIRAASATAGQHKC